MSLLVSRALFSFEKSSNYKLHTNTNRNLFLRVNWINKDIVLTCIIQWYHSPNGTYRRTILAAKCTAVFFNVIFNPIYTVFIIWSVLYSIFIYIFCFFKFYWKKTLGVIFSLKEALFWTGGFLVEFKVPVSDSGEKIHHEYK